MFASHRIYLVKKLIKHPVYNNQYIGFDLKYDTHKLINFNYEELRDVYKNKSFFRKIKLNKQPNILDKSYALKVNPYSEFSSEEIDLKCKNLEDENFIKNLTQILQEESSDFQDNQSQEEKFEEETIYTHNINYQDSILMNDFHLYDWEEKWNFAEKFRDARLKYFAAKHIFRNFPEAMPKKIFNHLHKKISERVLSLNKQKYITLPAAMEEADNLSYEIEENGGDLLTKEQIEEYNIYINFLNDYYNQQNPKPIKFDSDLSRKLFA
jgi:exodeoxyribonuclease-1